MACEDFWELCSGQEFALGQGEIRKFLIDTGDRSQIMPRSLEEANHLLEFALFGTGAGEISVHDGLDHT